ncbi:ATP-binding protein [Streptomyces canus]|uniref:ATP-binding protein n=1 Tax=Streptomyces canus TaxID=58343 RepID=UPI00381A97FB
MTPTKAAETASEPQVPPTRMALPGIPESTPIDEACRDLRPLAFRERFVEIGATTWLEQPSYEQFLQIEVAAREVRRRQRQVRAAKFSRPKRLEDCQAALVNELTGAEAVKRPSSVIARCSTLALLYLSEFGYLNPDGMGAKLLYQIFREREEGKATAVASDAPFSKRDKTFTDARLCTAITDRLTFKGTLIQTATDPCRIKPTETAHQAGHP